MKNMNGIERFITEKIKSNLSKCLREQFVPQSYDFPLDYAHRDIFTGFMCSFFFFFKWNNLQNPEFTRNWIVVKFQIINDCSFCPRNNVNQVLEWNMFYYIMYFSVIHSYIFWIIQLLLIMFNLQYLHMSKL